MSNQKESQEDNAENIVQALKDGYFCYALSYPLKEKNKLLEDITKYLERDKIPFAVIDPLRIDSQRKRKPQDFKWGERSAWYYNLVNIINQDFSLEYSANHCWNDNPEIKKNERLKSVIIYIENCLFHIRVIMSFDHSEI